MAIATYADLQSAIADWINRADLTTRIPDFIALAEARMMRKLRLRMLETETDYTTVVSSRTLALPHDYREPLNLWRNIGNSRDGLNFIPASVFTTYTVSGPPLYWSIDGANIALDRPADQNYSLTFRYIQKLALSNAVPTNILLTTYPDAYLTASLAEAYRFLKSYDEAMQWDTKHNQIAHDIREEEARTNAPATLHTEPGMLSQRRGSFNIYRGA